MLYFYAKMSVLLEFAIFPTDKGASVSEYVSQVVKMIRTDYKDHCLTAMGTIVETDTLEEALEVVHKSYAVLEGQSDRIYASIKLDIRAGQSNRLSEKIRSIQNRIGEE